MTAEESRETPAAGPRVEAVPRLCGCAGKTPLDDVVYPARRLIRARLAGTSVRLAGTLDAMLLPRTERLDRHATSTALGDGAGGGDTKQRPAEARSSPPAGDSADVDTHWVLGATFAPDTLADAERFAARVGSAYATLAATAGARAVVGKAHSVQVPSATTGRQWTERLLARGRRERGYRAANVDAVHAFPGLSPTRQARIAVVHALNDCYAVGGVDDRRVRPLIAAPADADADTEAVAEWYEAAAPAGVALDPPSVVEHDGVGWLFGASVVVSVRRRPPVRTGRVEAGDSVLLTRPLGALAAYSLAVDAGGDDHHESGLPAARHRAVAALTEDHHAVARALSSFSPALGESFDARRHLKVVTDVSGPGVDGVARRLPGGLGLHLTALPFLDRTAVDRSRERWVTPDATVETNGPLAVVGRPAVVERVERRLADVADPARLGHVRESTSKPASDATARLTADADVDVGRYVERHAREGPP